MPDTKFRPTSTMKSKDKSSEQRFGHVNATNRNSYLNIIFIKYKVSEKPILKTNIRAFDVFSFSSKNLKPRFLKPTSTALPKSHQIHRCHHHSSAADSRVVFIPCNSTGTGQPQTSLTPAHATHSASLPRCRRSAAATRFHSDPLWPAVECARCSILHHTSHG